MLQQRSKRRRAERAKTLPLVVSLVAGLFIGLLIGSIIYAESQNLLIGCLIGIILATTDFLAIYLLWKARLDKTI
jgi:F0F1-type ATP synthase assembly protein I